MELVSWAPSPFAAVSDPVAQSASQPLPSISAQTITVEIPSTTAIPVQMVAQPPMQPPTVAPISQPSPLGTQQIGVLPSVSQIDVTLQASAQTLEQIPPIALPTATQITAPTTSPTISSSIAVTQPKPIQVSPDKKIADVRAKIIEMMKETRDIELSQLGNVSTLRYYKMTSVEFEQRRANLYTFSIFLGVPKEESATEGFAYDISNLLTEKYIVLNAKVCFVPIIMSMNRWNYLIRKYGKSLGDYTFRTGELDLPLYQGELMHLFKNIRNHPILAADANGSIPMSAESIPKTMMHLSDESVGNRFGTVVLVNESATLPPTIAAQSPKPAQVVIPTSEQKIDSILSSVERELRDVGVEDSEVFAKLRSEETKRYIREMLQKPDISEAHVTSVLITDALTRVISRQERR